jgi:DnaJ family protein C protein 2
MILFLPEGDNEENKVLGEFSICIDLFRQVEPVGVVFENIVKAYYGFNSIEEKENSFEEENEIIEEEIEYEWEKEFNENSKNKENLLFSSKENYYQILGLANLNLKSKSEDFRKAYKKLAKLFHPDKNQDNSNSLDLNNEENKNNINETEKKDLTEQEKKQKEINLKWLKIKEAYDTLIDPEKRKKYDSTIEFDDSIPENKFYDEKDFFRTFGPVFLKNSIWSKKKPVPKIGDIKTPIEKVKKFYRFWRNFESWRDFSVEGEFNIEDADSRYEKRQMLKENKKMKASLIRKEKIRIDELTSIAYKCDPRIKIEEENLRKMREKEKLEIKMKKQKEKEEEEKKRKEFQEKYENEKKIEKEKKIQEKKNLIENYFNFAVDLNIKLDDEDKFQLNLNSNLDNLKSLINKINNIENQKEKKNEFINLSKNFFAMKIKSEIQENNNNNNNNIWTKEEMFLLQKGVKKFPAGTKNRWEKIKEIVKTKSTDEIINMTHYLLLNPSIKIEGDINLKDLIQKKESNNNNNNNNNTEEKKENKNKNSNNNWTAEEQKKLEECLKKYPNSLPAKERWTKISKEVGKTMKQCVDRYKYIAEVIKKNKSQNK